MTMCQDWDGFDAWCEQDVDHLGSHWAEVGGALLTWPKRDAS
jgi:hypothetical protein